MSSIKIITGKPKGDRPKSVRPESVQPKAELSAGNKAKNGNRPASRESLSTFPPRDQTLQILTRVLAENQPLEDAFEEWSDRLDARGKAWAWDVCQTIFRYRGGIDTLIDQHALKKKPTGRVRKQLWIAVVQVLFHKDVSPEKIVHESVEWVKRDSGAPASGFVNACLRKIADERIEWMKYLEGDFPGILPNWWIGEFKKGHSKEWVQAFARASLKMPSTWFRVKGSDSALKDLPSFFHSGPITGSFEWKGDPAELGNFARKKDFLVQDVAGQILVEENFREVAKKFKTPKVLDRCAAPGGKSIGLSWSGAEVYAYDSHERRRISLSTAVDEKATAIKILTTENEFPENLNWIWVDAPCSGSGVVRRHPEMKWIKNPKDLESLLKIQKELVEDSWRRLPSGGFFTYTVCSLFPAEGAEILKNAGLSEYIQKEWNLGPHLPQPSDGFYGALLLKP